MGAGSWHLDDTCLHRAQEHEAMRAVIEFELPEDRAEHQLALDAWKWQATVNDLDNHLRNIIKHGDDNAQAEHAQKIREELHKIMSDYDLHDW